MRDREQFSPAQCRAARGLLGWSVEDLAGRARLEFEAVELYEAEAGGLSEGELALIGWAFAELGEVIAIAERRGGEGVRRRHPRTPFANARSFPPHEMRGPRGR